MRFRKYGHTYQLEVENAADLEHVLTLNEAHWVATSAPTDAFRCDPKFVDYVDSDHNGRIRTDEFREAVRWFLQMLDDTSGITEGRDSLPLAAIHSNVSDGATIVASAKYILRSIGEADSETIALAHVRKFMDEIAKHPLNGDGVIIPGAAHDPEVAEFITDVLACFEGAQDASGKKGVTEEQLAEFQKGIEEYLDWKTRVHRESGPEIMTLGKETPALYATYAKHAREVDAFFAICRAAHFDPASAAQIVFPKADDAERDLTDIAVLNDCLKRLPLAKPTEDGRLPLSGDVLNPLYRDWVAELRNTVFPAVLERKPELLTEADWKNVHDAFAPYAGYLKEKRGAAVEKLPREKLEAYRSGALADKTRELIAADKRVAAILKDAREVEKLLLYHKYLLRLVNNFVNFSDLYNTDERAMFEMGSIVIDGRWFNMVLRVDDRNAHSEIAKKSNIFTIYLDITGKPDGKTDETFCVAVPATSGTKGNLVVGKRGIFFGIEGKPFDARVVQIIENPISLSEALSAPLTRLWSFMVGKIEAMSGSSEKDLQKTADTLMKAPSDAKAPGGMGPSGMLIGLSVSFAAIGSAFAFISKTFAGMTVTARLMSLVGAFLVVVVPVSLIAILKLAAQDLSALLEGCGWGINTPMRLNGSLRRQFTRRAPWPEDAEGTPMTWWTRLVIWLVIAALACAAAYTVPRLLFR